MNNWPVDLKNGAIVAAGWMLLMRLAAIVFGDLDGNMPSVFGFLWCWALFTYPRGSPTSRTYIVRRARIKQEIDDLMTALRISMTGK